MYCVTWAPMTVAVSLVWSMEILENDRAMGGEEDGREFISKQLAFLVLFLARCMSLHGSNSQR